MNKTLSILADFSLFALSKAWGVIEFILLMIISTVMMIFFPKTLNNLIDEKKGRYCCDDE